MRADASEPTEGRALRVLHLVGSPTDQFHADLSHVYAADCLEATADPERYAPLIVDVDPDGSWRFPAGIDGAARAVAAPCTTTEAIARLIRLDPDVAIPQMFCYAGLTTYRSLLDLLDIPSVGNPASVMALTADKVQARAVVAAAGVAVPEAQVVRPGDNTTLAPPVVVKPVAADNSVGVTLVRSRDDLDEALAAAQAHGGAALVERYVELGREVRCGTIVHDGALRCLPLEEYAVDPTHVPIRTVDDKLTRTSGGRLGLVAKDPTRAWIVDPADPVTGAVWDAATACHRALSCAHHGLFDFRIDPDGRPWFLEAGPYCPFARGSVVSTMARAVDIDIAELFAGAVALSLDRRPAGAPQGASSCT